MGFCFCSLIFHHVFGQRQKNFAENRAMILVKDCQSDSGKIEIFEFQGTFQNVELFDAEFDRSTLQMRFKGFILQGKTITKCFTVCSKDENGLCVLKKVSEVVLFDSPPRYNISMGK